MFLRNPYHPNHPILSYIPAYITPAGPNCFDERCNKPAPAGMASRLGSPACGNSASRLATFRQGEPALHIFCWCAGY